MPSVSRLLCAVDLSEPSRQALRFAAALHSLIDGELTVLYVHSSTARHLDTSASSESELGKFVREALGSHASIRLLEPHGDPVTGILSSADELRSDVIIMGTHGRSGMQRLLLGSVAERVIRRSQTAVLVVPAGFRKSSATSATVAGVLCAVDFSDPSSTAVSYAASIAAAAHARFVMFHALEWSEEIDASSNPGDALPTSEDDALARIKTLLTEDVNASCTPQLIVGYGTAADEVLRMVRDHQIDLVVLGNRRRNPVDLAVFGSTAQKLIRGGTCAVLTVRAGKT